MSSFQLLDGNQAIGARIKLDGVILQIVHSTNIGTSLSSFTAVVPEEYNSFKEAFDNGKNLQGIYEFIPFGNKEIAPLFATAKIQHKGILIGMWDVPLFLYSRHKKPITAEEVAKELAPFFINPPSDLFRVTDTLKEEIDEKSLMEEEGLNEAE